MPGLLAAAVAGACLVFLTVDDVTFDRYQLPKEFVLLACATALVPALVRRARFDALDAACGAVVAFTALSAVLAPTPGLSERTLCLTAASAVFFLSARRLARARQGLPWAVCIAAPAAVAVLALAESLGWVSGLSPAGRAPGASLGQRNEVAHVMVLASPAAWAFAANERGNRRALALGAAALFVAAIVQTRTRAAWVVGPVVLLVWLALEWRRTRTPRMLVSTTLAALLAITASVALPSSLDWRGHAPLHDTLMRLTDTSRGSGKGRVVQAEASLPLFVEHPLFGVGPGHWMVEYPRARPQRDPTFDAEQRLPTGRFPNADALGFLVERGAVFIFALLFALALAARKLWATEKDDALAPAAMALLLGALGLSFLDAVLHLAAPAVLTAVVLGLALPAAEEETTRSSRTLLALALTLLFAIATARAGSRLEGLWQKSRDNAGLEGLEAALTWNPFDYEARLRLAEALVLEHDCPRAAAHLRWLGDALPHHPSVQRLRASCGNP